MQIKNKTLKVQKFNKIMKTIYPSISPCRWCCAHEEARIVQ